MICNLVIKGCEEEVAKIADLFCEEYYGELEEQKNVDAVCTAWIYCSGAERDEVVDKLTNVKWIAFVEDYASRTLQVAISDHGSAQIDHIYTICDYDFHGDDRVASQYYPDSDFEADIFWESTGESEAIFYECPCEEWWNQE